MADEQNLHFPEDDELNDLYKCYLKTSKTNDIKTIFDSMKELVRDVNMVFTPEGLMIKEIDDQDSVMVYLFLDNLGGYFCPETVKIGISIPNFSKLLKNIGNSLTVCLYIEKDDQCALNMEIDNGDPNQTKCWSIKLMDLEKSDEPALPEIDYGYKINMKSADFKNICQDVKATGAKNLKITYLKGEYHFQSESDISDYHEIRRSHKPMSEYLDDDDDDENSEEAYADGVYTGLFDVEHLSCFTKCTSASKYVTLQFENDRPLICEYEVAGGTYRLYLSPVDIED
jgi:proliferating cell nuclear antigen PCNA